MKDLIVLKGDLLVRFWDLSGTILQGISPYLPGYLGGEITKSVIFFAVTHTVNTFLRLPLSYYDHFVLEERFGFNKTTLRTWLLDTVKLLVLNFAIISPIIAGLIKIVDYFGDSFAFYLGVFGFVVLLVLYTILGPLQHLFYKFTRLEDGELKSGIEELAKKLQFPVTDLYVCDASTRSSHSNAFFVGLPWAKRIVLFDTIIEKLSQPEILSVLAHELGHWKLLHTTQSLIALQLALVLQFVIFSAFIKNSSLYTSFGFTGQVSTLIGYILVENLATPIGALITLLENSLVRRNEYQADAFAKLLGYQQELSKALIKFQVNELQDVSTDAYYSAYFLSLPTTWERLEALGYFESKNAK